MAKGGGYSNQWGNEPWGALPGGQIVRGKRAGIKKLSSGGGGSSGPAHAFAVARVGGSSKHWAIEHAAPNGEGMAHYRATQKQALSATQKIVEKLPAGKGGIDLGKVGHPQTPSLRAALAGTKAGRWITMNGHHVFIED